MDELTERIRRYYGAINVGAFTSLQMFIDLDLLNGFKDTQLLEKLFCTFRKTTGSIQVLEIVMDVHQGENLPQYCGRDYAVGKVKWKDSNDRIGFFKEKWVKGERVWFNRHITPQH